MLYTAKFYRLLIIVEQQKKIRVVLQSKLIQQNKENYSKILQKNVFKENWVREKLKKNFSMLMWLEIRF